MRGSVDRCQLLSFARPGDAIVRTITAVDDVVFDAARRALSLAHEVVA
jgi:hypothetical protein